MIQVLFRKNSTYQHFNKIFACNPCICCLFGLFDFHTKYIIQLLTSDSLESFFFETYFSIFQFRLYFIHTHYLDFYIGALTLQIPVY